jgi:integrase
MSGLETKRMILRVHLVPELGAVRLDQIGPPEVEAYKAKKLHAKLARKTINNHLTVLRKMLSTAGEWRLLASAPPIKWMKPPPPEFDFLTFEEAEHLIAASEADWRAMITIGLRTGLRLGELLALRWMDVDLQGERLMVRRSVARGIVGTPKNGRTREVELSNQAVAVLRDHPRRGPLVFCDAEGNMLTKGTTKWPLWSACQKAGLRRIGYHCLRQDRSTDTRRLVPLCKNSDLTGRSISDAGRVTAARHNLIGQHHASRYKLAAHMRHTRRQRSRIQQ